MNKTADITDILKGEAQLPPYFFALAPAAWLYGLIMRVRSWMYRKGALKVRRLPCKVVSVGNITAGGTGKTPMVAYLARRFMADGYRTAVVTRGYKGRKEGGTLVVSDGDVMLASQPDAGDEASLIATSLPGVPVIMGKDRYEAGMVAVERFGAQVVILDDGFQHMALGRDLDLLLLDSQKPFGNGRVLPMGYLREPADAISRADMVVFTRSDRVEPAGLDREMSAAAALNPSAGIAVSVHSPVRLYGHPDGSELELSALAGAGVFGFSGIADPASFALILKQLHANILGFKGFPDHHEYTHAELEKIAGEAVRTGAVYMVTTEKDAVKIGGFEHAGVRLLVLGVDIKVVSGGELLEKLINDRLFRG